ncbi:MAG: F0F1 ATP synthase subunit B' [Reyranella sp.]|jgi:F-type H+-transporting ATPase subunit b|nr:F0F1 ATP synthase subunit B' [Reyranella sp.]MBL6651606.1 F0F1 ATP synthase subunit B' [Reyranella sp.]
MRKPVHAAFAALAVLVASGSAMAKEGSGGMPQLDYHSFAPQLVWLAIAFLALYLVMSRLAVPAISDTLAKRQGKIQGDLDAAEKANEETRALVQAYEKRMADSREDARKVVRDRSEADSAAAAARLAALHDKLNQQIGEAEKRIAKQRDDVMAGLETMAKDIGQEVYAKLAGQPADQAALSAKIAAAAKGGR